MRRLGREAVIFMLVAMVLAAMVALSGCSAESRRADKTASPSYFAKKIECQKYETEILNDWKSTASSRSYSQLLDRIFYSPSLDTCVVIIYRLPNSETGERQVEIRDVLTEKVLWYAEYPMNGVRNKSYEEAIADADAEIQKKGWGEK
jgi:hypothetical protein